MDVTPQRYFTIGAVNAPQNGISAVVRHSRDLVYLINKWLQKKGSQHLGIRLRKSCIFLTILSLLLDYDHSIISLTCISHAIETRVDNRVDITQ